MLIAISVSDAVMSSFAAVERVLLIVGRKFCRSYFFYDACDVSTNKKKSDPRLEVGGNNAHVHVSC